MAEEAQFSVSIWRILNKIKYLIGSDQPEVVGRVRDDVTFLGQSSLTFDLVTVDSDDVIEKQTINAQTENSVRAKTLAYQTNVLHLVLHTEASNHSWLRQPADKQKTQRVLLSKSM